MAQVKFLKIGSDGYDIEMDTTNDEITLASIATTGATMDADGITIPTGKAITITDAPSAGTDATNKDYVQSYVQGLDPQESVLSKSVATPPGSPDTGDRYIVDDAGNDAITGVNTGSKTFTVAGDQTTYYTADDIIKVRGSTGNNGWFTVVSATFDTDHTDIVVSETISDATVDGTIYYSTGVWTDAGVDKIVEYDGANWDVTTPNFGFNAFVEDEDTAYVYLTTHTWGTLASAVNHNNLTGLQGGTTNEYYHMTSAEDTWLAGAITKVATPSNIADLTDNDVITGNYSLGASGEMDCTLGEFTFPNAVSASPTIRDAYVDASGNLFIYDGSTWNQVGITGDATITTYTSGSSSIQFKVVRISGTDTVNTAQADALANAKGTIGICLTDTTSGQPVEVQEDGVVTGCLSGATAGTPYFLSSATAGALTTTPPSSGVVLLMGYSKNATDLHLQIQPIRVRA